MNDNVPDVYTVLWNGLVTEEFSAFRSKQFNTISVQKLEIVYELIMLGHNVLFSDVDVLFLRDPIPVMVFDNVDYSFGYNKKCVR